MALGIAPILAKKGRFRMTRLIEGAYALLWNDLFVIPLPGGGSLGVSLLVALLIPTGVFLTARTRFLPIRLFPDMLRALVDKRRERSSLSAFQTLIVSTATRVGMGNLVGLWPPSQPEARARYSGCG